MSRGAVGDVLAGASADEAQLLLSLLVWPEECPDPRVVDEWLRRQAGRLEGCSASAARAGSEVLSHLSDSNPLARAGTSV